jgi:ferredoxin-thioredoxin reductase catalytic subunit
MEGNETQTSCAGTSPSKTGVNALVSRASRFGKQCAPCRDGRNKSGHDEETHKPAHDGGKALDEKISANPYVLQELAKEPADREHEIISYRRRHLVKPHGYPLSGRDGAGKRVLFHSDEKEKFGAEKA